MICLFGLFVYLDDILIFSCDPTSDPHTPGSAEAIENKLDYITESGQVKTDPEKILTVAEWPKPNTRKQLQQFLGFATFYCRFMAEIHGKLPLSSNSPPLSFFSPGPQKLNKLSHLTSAPILVQLDASRQFILEVKALNSCVGAVLSQCSGPDQKLYPCAFFFHCLSIAECNYDVGTHELCAVKLALDEWRHWLEEAEHPFVVWTDQKELA